MARKSERLTEKRSLCDKIGFVTKTLNNAAFGVIANSIAILIYGRNPRELEMLYFISLILIWTIFAISFLINLIAICTDEESSNGVRITRNDFRKNKKNLSKSMILVIIALLTRPLASNLFYIALSTLSGFSCLLNFIAFGLSKSNAQESEKINGVKSPVFS